MLPCNKILFSHPVNLISSWCWMSDKIKLSLMLPLDYRVDDRASVLQWNGLVDSWLSTEGQKVAADKSNPQLNRLRLWAWVNRLQLTKSGLKTFKLTGSNFRCRYQLSEFNQLLTLIFLLGEAINHSLWTSHGLILLLLKLYFQSKKPRNSMVVNVMFHPQEQLRGKSNIHQRNSRLLALF